MKEWRISVPLKSGAELVTLYADEYEAHRASRDRRAVGFEHTLEVREVGPWTVESLEAQR